MDTPAEVLRTLSQEYPDLAQSTILEVLKSVDGAHNARALLADMTTKEPSEATQERLIKDLDVFKELGESLLRKTLLENDWDPDRAMLPLFHLLETKREEERAMNYEQERNVREQKARAEELFRTIPEDKIQEILDANDGDVDATTEELVRQVDLFAAQSEKERHEKERNRNTEMLVIKFGFSPEDTRTVLSKHNWNLQEAVKDLVKRDTERRLQEFFALFPEAEIRDIACVEGYDMVKTQVALVSRVKEKKEEEEKERIRREQEEKKRAEEEEKARDNERLRVELERKKKEEEEKKKVEEELRKKREAEERLRREKEEEEKAKEAQNMLLQQSIQITKEIVAAKNKTAGREDVREKQLEDKMRHGSDLPGFMKVKEADTQKADRVELASSFQSTSDKPEPVPSADHVKGVDTDVVKLVLSPTRVDCGKAINVEWQHSAEPTSRDWIALYLEGKSGKEYVTYEWVSQRKGQISFSAPHICGNYHVVYYTNGSYESYGVSGSVAVGPIYDLSASLLGNQVKVSIDVKFGSASPLAWVAMYPSSGTSLNEYYTYQWVSDKKELVFDVPKTGSWHFKLFPQKTLQATASCDVQVDGENSLELTTSDSFAFVKFNVATLDPNTDNIWVGIYHKEEGNQRQWRRAKGISTKEGTLQFKKMIHTGTYEARLFANRTYEVRHKSNTISIEGIE